MINNKSCPICSFELQDNSVIDINNPNRKLLLLECMNCMCYSIQQDKVIISGVVYGLSEQDKIQSKIQENKMLYQELVGKLGVAEQKIELLENTVQKQETIDNGLEFWKQMKQQEIDLLNESLKKLKKDE